MEFSTLYNIALKNINPRQLSKRVEAGFVSSAILSGNGNVYTGVCIETPCGIGFCAEHAAISSMVNSHENEIRKIVTVDRHGNIMPPCGRCRELIKQIHINNLHSEILIKENYSVLLKDLLPFDWGTIDEK